MTAMKKEYGEKKGVHASIQAGKTKGAEMAKKHGGKKK